MLSHFWSSL